VNQATETATGTSVSAIDRYEVSPTIYGVGAGGRRLSARHAGGWFVRDFPLTIRHVSAGPLTCCTTPWCTATRRARAGRVPPARAPGCHERNRAETELARYRDHLEDLIRAEAHELETANADLQCGHHGAQETGGGNLIASTGRSRRSARASGHDARHRSESAYLNEVCQIIVRDGGHSMVWIGFWSATDPERTVQAGGAGGFRPKAILESLQVHLGGHRAGSRPHRHRDSHRETKRFAGTCRRILISPRWREEALRRGYVSSIVVPLMEGRRTFGTITIYSGEPDSSRQKRWVCYRNWPMT